MFTYWHVEFSPKAAKQVAKLNKKVVLVVQALVENLLTFGPAPGRSWPNYGKLQGSAQENKRHCHLIKGKPTYVCCWRVYKAEKLIEVYYVGTHENAPY